jgi:hypothetical protein
MRAITMSISDTYRLEGTYFNIRRRRLQLFILLQSSFIASYQGRASERRK